MIQWRTAGMQVVRFFMNVDSGADPSSAGIDKPSSLRNSAKQLWFKTSDLVASSPTSSLARSNSTWALAAPESDFSIFFSISCTR